MELHELLEQNSAPDTRLKEFGKSLAEKGERDEILKEINNQVNTRVNTFFNFFDTAPGNLVKDIFFNKVNDSIRAEVKGKGGIKGKVRQLLADEHYMHYQDGKIAITDDYEGKKGAKPLDLDIKWHRRILGGVLNQLSDPAEFLSSLEESAKAGINAILLTKINELHNIISYVHDLDQLEQNFDKEVEENEAVTKKQAKALRKVLRKDINLDKKEGEFNELLKNYKNPEVVAEEAQQKINAATELSKGTGKTEFEKKYKDAATTNLEGLTYESVEVKTDLANGELTGYIGTFKKGEVGLGIEFDKDMNVISQEVTGSDNNKYTIAKDGEKLTATLKPDEIPAPTPGVDKPEDNSFVEITLENDKKPILDLLTGVTITDGKLYKSPTTGDVAFYKVTGKAEDKDFTLYLDNDRILQIEKLGKLKPVDEESVISGGYIFTQNAEDNKISVAKKVDEEGAPETPEDLSTRTIEQIKEASSEAIVGRLGELIEKLANDKISYIPGGNARNDGTYKDNPDIAWIQKGLVEYAKKNSDFALRGDGVRDDSTKWSASGDEYKFNGGNAPSGFDENSFISGEYDKGFAGSVASYQDTVNNIITDGLPGEETLTSLIAALSPSE